ncbi:MAG: hypothetical protein GY865_19720 [candidate division Zixibacteria bacterium]|nr:hypothetical protein [candidate division Zixibacteria bacterium]
MKIQTDKNKETNSSGTLIIVEWVGLLWCLVGLFVVCISNYIVIFEKGDILGFGPINVRNQFEVSIWLIPGLVLMIGARLLRKYNIKSNGV